MTVTPEAAGDARLPPQPWMTARATRAVFDALAAGGAEARFVGGCVRDALLGRPVKDIDIATPAPPDRVVALLGAAGLRTVPTGLAHGTVTALSGGAAFEITTLRRDVETFGRHARVAFTDDWLEDAGRRDFTMNAMSCTADGRVFDPFGGLADLAGGRVRFVGDPERRIDEDVLRLLRFFRFYAHYGRGGPDAAALAACAARAGRLPELSGERVRTEMLRLLVAPSAASVWRLMRGLGVLAPLFPDTEEGTRLDRLIRVERLLGLAAEPLVRLACGLPGDAAAAAADRLKLSNIERTRLLALAEPPFPLRPGDPPQRLARARYRIGDDSLYRDLVRLACSGPGAFDLRRAAEALAVAEALPNKRPLSGRDLLAIGIPPGPRVGFILKLVEEWWMARDFLPGRAQCLEKAQLIISN